METKENLDFKTKNKNTDDCNEGGIPDVANSITANFENGKLTFTISSDSAYNSLKVKTDTGCSMNSCCNGLRYHYMLKSENPPTLSFPFITKPADTVWVWVDTDGVTNTTIRGTKVDVKDSVKDRSNP